MGERSDANPALRFLSKISDDQMVVFFCCVIEVSASSTLPHNKKIASDDEILRVATDSHLRLVAGIGERFIARPKGLRFFYFVSPLVWA